MRVLFLDARPAWIHSLVPGFAEAGHEVALPDRPLHPFAVPRLIAAFRPELIFSAAWGPEQDPATQGWTFEHARAAGAPYVHWSVEDPAHTDRFTLPLVLRHRPDLVFTVCPEAVPRLRDAGFRAAHLDFAHQPSLHRPLPAEERYRAAVAVVANPYAALYRAQPDHYKLASLRNLVAPLVTAGLRVDVYGDRSDWEAMRAYGLDVPPGWLRGPLPYEAAPRVYSSAEIVLGPQNYRTQLAQRTYEILGCGALLLTDDVPAVRRRFVPGRDLLASASPQQTVRLVRRYLVDPAERRRIRAQARLAVAGDTYRHRAERAIEVLRAEGVLADRSR